VPPHYQQLQLSEVLLHFISQFNRRIPCTIIRKTPFNTDNFLLQMLRQQLRKPYIMNRHLILSVKSDGTQR